MTNLYSQLNAIRVDSRLESFRQDEIIIDDLNDGRIGRIVSPYIRNKSLLTVAERINSETIEIIHYSLKKRKVVKEYNKAAFKEDTDFDNYDSWLKEAGQ